MLERCRASAPGAHIVVVDDRSPDGTGELAEEAAAELGQITVLARDRPKGQGSAYRHGFQTVLAEGVDVIVSMDVDFSHDPAEIPAMLARLEDGADAVIGSRYVEGGGIVNWPLHRRLLSSWGNRYTAAMLRLGVRDCTSGFRAYRASALRAIDPAGTTAEGYAFLTELLRRLVAAGLRIEEVPIQFVDRVEGRSKMSARIIAESMLLVTRWGVQDAVKRLRDRRASR